MRAIQTFWYRTLRRPYRLAMAEFGQGRPVVLLHGIASSGQVWAPLVKQLADNNNWRVIVPDLLGFGASPKPDWNDYTVQEHARMVVALLKHRKVRGPVVLVGHSMGCLVAVHIAWRHPRLVERLVLYEPPLFADDPQYRAHMRRRNRYFQLFAYAAKRSQLAYAQTQVLWRVLKRLSGLRLDQDGWVPFERSLKNTIMGQAAYHELRKIAVPTDIVHGRLDFVVIRTELKRMFKTNPHIALHLVTDMHGVSARSAKYLARLLSEPALKTSDI